MEMGTTGHVIGPVHGISRDSIAPSLCHDTVVVGSLAGVGRKLAGWANVG